MKGLIATLTIATALVVATPASAHTWGGSMYFGNGSQIGLDNNPQVTNDEAVWATLVALNWNEGISRLGGGAYKRVGPSSVWVLELSPNRVVHSCLVSWHFGGPAPGWAVRCYNGWVT